MNAQGKSFFDQWEFDTADHNNGAVEYVTRDQAGPLAQAFSTHAVIRTGEKSSSSSLKRQSVKLLSKKKYTHFLTAMRFSHTPFGHGVWPSFWTTGDNWPNEGELDILEYAGEDAAKMSFHTGTGANKCKLDQALLNKPGCPAFPDQNGMGYNCETDYPAKLGCAPFRDGVQRFTGEEWAQNPGVIAAEYTDAYIKVFWFPESQIPGDFASDAPQPDTWDKWIVSYYPFADSQASSPGSCAAPLGAQQIILQIELCGDWASKVFGHPTKATCQDKDASDAGDCCTQFIMDSANDKYLHERAHFNISWVKVYTDASALPNDEAIVI